VDKKATATQLTCSAMRERKTQTPRHTGTAYKLAAKRPGTWSESQYSTVWRMLSSMASRYFGPYSMCPCAQLLPAPYYSPPAQVTVSQPLQHVKYGETAVVCIASLTTLT